VLRGQSETEAAVVVLDDCASLLASLLSKVTFQNSRASGVVAYEGAIDRGASCALRHLKLASPPWCGT
jgi:hypothetical protein